MISGTGRQKSKFEIKERGYLTATSTSDSLPLGPVTRAERIEVLDILRGWAIFGVLLVNMTNDQDWSDLFGKLWSGPVN